MVVRAVDATVVSAGASGGAHVMVVGVEESRASDGGVGPHYHDDSTAMLAALGGMYEDFQHVRIASMQRGLEGFYGEDLDRLVNRASSRLSKALRSHPVWPWLSDYPGLGGVHTARLLGYLRDPHRFPGARSVWHYCGVHVVNGRLPMRRKGIRCDWNPACRTAILMPGGIAEQIVRLRVPVYRDIYDRNKERLRVERGVEVALETESDGGAALESSGVEAGSAIEPRSGPGTRTEGAAPTDATDARLGPLRPFQIDQRARIIAAKAFVADLWAAWKAAT